MFNQVKNKSKNIYYETKNLVYQPDTQVKIIGGIKFVDDFKGGNSPNISYGTTFSIIDRYVNGDGETP